MRKIFLILLLLLISNFAFSDTIQELTQRLDESTTTINQLVETIKDKNKEIENLTNSNKELTQQLENSSSTILDLIKRVQADQEEITNLRNLLKETSNYVKEENKFLIGGNVSYPLGGQIIFGIKTNLFNIYSVFHIDKNLYISSGIGVIHEF